MAYIHDDATPALREAYQKVGASRGRVANVFKVHSVNPAATTAHLERYKTLRFARSEPTRVEREAMAVAVSAANACAYGVAHHAAALGTAGADPTLIEALTRDPDGAPPTGAPAPSSPSRAGSRARRQRRSRTTCVRCALQAFRMRLSPT